jgi:hypothetical protein
MRLRNPLEVCASLATFPHRSASPQGATSCRLRILFPEEIERMIRIKPIAAFLLSGIVMLTLTGCPHRHHDDHQPPPPEHHDGDHDHDHN